MEYLSVKNLEKYQSGAENTYWIKLWKKIREDWAIKQLTDSEKWWYVELIILATDCGNNIPLDLKYLSHYLTNNGHKEAAGRQVAGKYEGSRVASGVQKMLDLGLILKNVSIQIREDKIRKEKKSFYKNNPMRTYYGKRQVLEKGQWMEFAGKESEVEYR